MPNTVTNKRWGDKRYPSSAKKVTAHVSEKKNDLVELCSRFVCQVLTCMSYRRVKRQDIWHTGIEKGGGGNNV